MIKCAIYARYSSHNQKETSIQDQIRLCKEFAERMNWEVLENHIYADEATSGTSLKNRRNLQRLIELVKSGQAPFDYVLIEDTSRLARNIVHALAIAREFYFHEVKIYFVAQNIDTGNESISDAMIAVAGIVDDLFIKNLSQKTKRGMEGRFLSGFSTGGRAYGYRSVPVYGEKTDRYGNKEVRGYKIVIYDEEAKVVKETFLLYSQGFSATKIANILNERLRNTSNPKPPRGKWWSAPTIRSILKNKKYIGIWEWGKTTTIRNKETGQIKRRKIEESQWRIQYREDLRIIEDELWQKVQSLLKKRRAVRKHFSKIKSKYSHYLLTGLLRCGHCSSSIVVVRSKKNKGFYGCSGRHNKGEVVCKNDLKFELEQLEKHLLTNLKTFFDKNIEKISGYLYKIANFIKSKEDEEKLKREIAGIEALLEKLKEADASLIVIKDEINYLQNKKKELKVQLNSLNTSLLEFTSKTKIKTLLKEYLNKLKKLESSKLRLELLDLVSGKVKVENKTWKIQCVIDIYELAQRLLKRCIKYKTGTRFKLYTPLDFSFEFTVSPIVPRTKMGIPKERKIQVDILRQMLLFELPAKVEKRKRRQRKPNTKTNLSEKGKFKQLSLFDHNS